MTDEKNKNKEVAIDVNLDSTPILYADSVFMNINKNGVVLDICQRLGNTNKVRIVSRIGMSQEHAQKFAQELAKLIAVGGSQPQTAVSGNKKIIN